MSLTLPVLIIIAIFGVLIGFFRHLLVKVVVIIAVEVLLFVLFPDLLTKLAQLVEWARQMLR